MKCPVCDHKLKYLTLKKVITCTQCGAKLSYKYDNAIIFMGLSCIVTTVLIASFVSSLWLFVMFDIFLSSLISIIAFVSLVKITVDKE